MKTKDVEVMLAGKFVEFVQSAARNFRASYMNDKNAVAVKQEVVDAIIVEFIHRMAIFQGIDAVFSVANLREAEDANEWCINFCMTRRIIVIATGEFIGHGVRELVLLNHPDIGDLDKDNANTIVADIVAYILAQL